MIAMSYFGLSSVIFIEDVEGDLLGDAAQEAGRMQVPLEAEQPVDPPLGGRADRRVPTAQPRYTHTHRQQIIDKDVRGEIKSLFHKLDSF